MKRLAAHQGLAAGASVVTVALTGAAFWLSYEHLHDVADDNGLDGARAWVWPGTVDLFIVAGELLILRAALRGRFDWFAYLLAGVGSLGSIALNVAGVGEGARPMEYIVAAVPPVAALLAFAAVMRQVHERLVPHAEATDVSASVPEPSEEFSSVAEPERNLYEELAAAQIARQYGVEPFKLDVIQLEESTTVERVPEAYPALGVRVPAVPEAVPAGVRLLPIVARPDAALDVIQGSPVLAAEYPSTRPEVHAEYVPEGVPEDDDEEPVADPDPLILDIPISFENLLRQGGTPSVRSLRSTYSIGQARAQRLRDHFDGSRS